MNEYPTEYIRLLNIQIGCLLKVNRLKKAKSQLDLALTLNSNSTMIGRIERAEVIGGWDKIYLLSQALRIDFAKLFILLPKLTLLSIVDEIYSMETKLTSEKKEYYKSLKKEIENNFSILVKNEKL
jgi:transcriptional regulator with XRE-family HTH domain